jgi:hypothetical protein
MSIYLKDIIKNTKEQINNYKVYSYSSYFFENLLLLLFKNKLFNKKKYLIIDNSNKFYYNIDFKNFY